ncbi:hypothetical protein F4693_003087 [Sphingomonas endophytica]|uniref:Uncharacterized protein n=1 Tax=Sphingomonas endophytica TaxID=869719 RepID=A0A7X0MQG6_9SPHN|nr:hypothetical protein [Sphingomonas endophytica]
MTGTPFPRHPGLDPGSRFFSPTANHRAPFVLSLSKHGAQDTPFDKLRVNGG